MAEKSRTQSQTPDENAGENGGARPFWSGTITFGLVSVPVDFYAAARPRRASLRMLGPDGIPLRRRYVCAADGEPLSGDDIVRGYPVDGRFVTVSDDELTELLPEKTRDIDLQRFVDRSAIDPMLFDRPYILAPAGKSTKAYHLLAGTMMKNDRAGIATFVMRGKEHPVAIFADDGLLWAVTLRFADEVRTPEDIGLPAVKPVPTRRRREMEAAIKKHTAKKLDRALLQDIDADHMLSLAEKKRAAHTDVIETPDELRERPVGELENVVDLMALLKERVGSTSSPSAKPSRKPGPSRKPTRASPRKKPTKPRPQRRR